jgi:hypothetical protein
MTEKEVDKLIKKLKFVYADVKKRAEEARQTKEEREEFINMFMSYHFGIEFWDKIKKFDIEKL